MGSRGIQRAAYKLNLLGLVYSFSPDDMLANIRYFACDLSISGQGVSLQYQFRRSSRGQLPYQAR